MAVFTLHHIVPRNLAVLGEHSRARAEMDSLNDLPKLLARHGAVANHEVAAAQHPQVFGNGQLSLR